MKAQVRTPPALFAVAAIIAASCSRMPAATKSFVAGGYSQPADANRPLATVVVEVTKPIVLLRDNDQTVPASELYCVDDWEHAAQNFKYALSDHSGTAIEPPQRLFLLPAQVEVDGDQVSSKRGGYVTAYTDDGQQGAVCNAQLHNVRIAPNLK